MTTTWQNNEDDDNWVTAAMDENGGDRAKRQADSTTPATVVSTTPPPPPPVTPVTNFLLPPKDVIGILPTNNVTGSENINFFEILNPSKIFLHLVKNGQSAKLYIF